MKQIESIGDFKNSKHCFMIELSEGFRVEVFANTRAQAAKLARSKTNLDVRSVNMIG